MSRKCIAQQIEQWWQTINGINHKMKWQSGWPKKQKLAKVQTNNYGEQN